MNPEISLGDFVKQLAALLHKERVDMPFKNQRPWHFLLYELKSVPPVPGKPKFFEELVFDWDGPYPKSQELSDFLHALHWNASVSANNPHYDTIKLTDDVAELWLRRYEELNQETKDFVTQALKRAQAEFPQALDATKAPDVICSVG